LIFGRAGDDEVAVEGETVDVVEVEFFGEEVRVVDDHGFFAVSSGGTVPFEFFQTRNGP
jgi:hypothetical protein